MKKLMLQFSAVALLALMMVSCNNNIVYSEQKEISDFIWDRSEVVEFKFDIADTAQRYNIITDIRHTNFYVFSNLWVMVYTTYPDGTQLEPERLQLTLADVDGRWYGDCAGDICDLENYIQQNVRFEQAGTYTISFEQIMRSKDVPVLERLPGIMALGLSLEKVDQEPSN